MLLWVWIVEGIWHRCIWRLSSSALQLWNCRSLHKLRQKRGSFLSLTFFPCWPPWQFLWTDLGLAVYLPGTWLSHSWSWLLRSFFLGSSLLTPMYCSKKSVSGFYVYVLETLSWSLGWEDPLEKSMVTHSSILTWRIPWTEEPGRLQSMGVHNWAANPFTF